jgi:branched-chain amino acid transport system ATP-binding protein
MALLEITGLGHSFGGLAAVKGFDLTLREGQLLGLIGPNGAGKTTVFNLVSGFYRPEKGRILFRGQSIAGLRTHEVSAIGMARTFQNIRMWNTMTVLENLSIARHARLGYGLPDVLFQTGRFRSGEGAIAKKAFEILKALGLEEHAGENPGNLPYGLQRRVEIGRALTAEPRLLLLDEPAAGMNPREIGDLIDLIGRIRRRFNITIWLIEHQMRVVMGLCERIQVLDFGKTIAEGTPVEIRENPRVVKAYLGEERAPKKAVGPHA